MNAAGNCRSRHRRSQSLIAAAKEKHKQEKYLLLQELHSVSYGVVIEWKTEMIQAWFGESTPRKGLISHSLSIEFGLYNMTILRTALIISLLLCITSEGWAQIHVGPGQAYPDIGAAAHARIVHPGDTIFVHKGTYDKAQYVIDSLIGTPGKWITIMPFGHDSVS